MADQIDLESMRLPPVPEELNIEFPLGFSLAGFNDFSQGLPDDGALAFSLISQLSPMLGSMGCLIKIMEVLDKLKTFMTALSVPPTSPLEAVTKFEELAEAGKEIIPLIIDVLTCYPPLATVKFAQTVKGTIDMVLRILDSLVDQLEAILKYTENIKNIDTEGNPALQDALAVAQGNADLMVEHLMASLGPVQPILNIATNLAEMIELPVELPSLSDLSSGEDLSETIETVSQTIDTMKQVVESLPG